MQEAELNLTRTFQREVEIAKARGYKSLDHTGKPSRIPENAIVKDLPLKW